MCVCVCAFVRVCVCVCPHVWYALCTDQCVLSAFAAQMLLCVHVCVPTCVWYALVQISMFLCVCRSGAHSVV